MIFELRDRGELPSVDVDLCIVGGGAAGIAMAREFTKTNISVALLESGGYNFDKEVQALYEGESVGEQYFQLDKCRSRQFGGSTNCWAGMCTPLTEIDFRQRSWVPFSGWPISLGDLEPYLRRAHDLCGMGPYGYDEALWQDLPEEPLSFDRQLFYSHFWQINDRFGRRRIRFARKFHKELKATNNVVVYLHANVTTLILDSSGRKIDSVKIRTLDGRAGRVRAKCFVLACGGIENARLLLASNQQKPEGLGNSHDLVGRFFMEHLEAPCATVIPKPNDRLLRYSRMYKLGAAHALPGLTLSPAAQEHRHTLNASFSINPVYKDDYLWSMVKDLHQGLRELRFRSNMLTDALRIARKPHILFPDLYNRLLHGTRPIGKPVSYTLFARAEQAPNRESRVRLGTEKDQVGMRKVILDWRTNDLDRRAFTLMVDLARVEFDRLDLGTVCASGWLQDHAWPRDLKGGPHHMGTTRMSEDPRFGVVDVNSKVHGIDGLYIAGSSIFPTGGHANCTLTLLATTLRLSDHLRATLSKK